MVLLNGHGIGFLFRAFAGGELQQLFIQRVVINLAILVLQQDVEQLPEMGQRVSRPSLPLRRLEVVVTLRVCAVVRNFSRASTTSPRARWGSWFPVRTPSMLLLAVCIESRVG